MNIMSLQKIGTTLFKTLKFGKGAGKTALKAADPLPQKMTRTLTDPSSGIVRMEREITYAGKDALAVVQKMPNGTSKIEIRGGGDNPIWRTKTITREKGASAFGGDKITVEKDYTKYWCHGEKSKLTKEYNPKGELEHKELDFKYYTSENEVVSKAVQDRVYAEYPLKSGEKDMLCNPWETDYIKHSLEKSSNGKFLNSKDNYSKFADKAETNYTRAVAAKKQAAVDAAKKAEEEALAAQKAAEKAAAELRAKQPRINTSKALGIDIGDLKVKETVNNGTTIRTFSDPKTGKVLVKTKDCGIGHEEWIYGGKADKIYMKQIGKEDPYIVAKKGNCTFINRTEEYKDCGKKLQSRLSDVYYNDGLCGAKGYTYSDRVFINRGPVANRDGGSVNRGTGQSVYGIEKYANKNYIDVDDLFSAYKV